LTTALRGFHGRRSGQYTPSRMAPNLAKAQIDLINAMNSSDLFTDPKLEIAAFRNEFNSKISSKFMKNS
jgi:hypothetical protein